MALDELLVVARVAAVIQVVDLLHGEFGGIGQGVAAGEQGAAQEGGEEEFFHFISLFDVVKYQRQSVSNLRISRHSMPIS